jgi:hypothetical protein
MRSDQKISQYLQELQVKHPQALRGNFLFYSALKTKGMLDEVKELLPWLLGAMIFIPVHFILKDLISQFGYATQALHFATLSIMLLLMFYVPLILKQAKHSSHSFYQQQKHAPIKLAAVIILQAINTAYLDSVFLQGVLLFFAISFGFIRFYKENLFREHATKQDYYALQQIRRASFWSYKQTIWAKWRYRLMKKGSKAAKLQSAKLQYYLTLHLQLYKYEHEFCKKVKHLDIEKYLDSLM